MSVDRRRLAAASRRELHADELKDSVREMLILMGTLERKLFIKTLEYEMLRSGLRMQAHLTDLGIAAARAEDLTPCEVGHLIEYFRINVPIAMLAVARVLGGCPVPASGREMMAAWLSETTRH